MANKREYWGLDLETSGTTHEDHVPIQLGLTAPSGITATWLIGGWLWWEDDLGPANGDMYPGGRWSHWSEEAAQVHGITQAQLQADGLPAAKVALEAVRFIEAFSDTWLGNRHVVGWNVASFDMPFVRQHLGALSRVLSYRSVDLNAVCFTLTEAHGISYKGLKRRSKEYAAEQLRETYPGEMWHDAGYDSAAALHSWDYMKERVKNGY